MNIDLIHYRAQLQTKLDAVDAIMRDLGQSNIEQSIKRITGKRASSADLEKSILGACGDWSTQGAIQEAADRKNLYAKLQALVKSKAVEKKTFDDGIKYKASK